MDDKAQISAEMILLMGALMVLVIVAGNWIFHMSNSVANATSNVISNATSSTINKM